MLLFKLIAMGDYLPHNYNTRIQARIAHLVAYWLGTGKVPGSNPGKGENFSVKIWREYFQVVLDKD